MLISIHALREEGDLRGCSQSARYDLISIHALREEGDVRHRWWMKCLCNFYPRPPRGGRLKNVRRVTSVTNFYPRPPRGGRPDNQLDGVCVLDISIHALREEGDRQPIRASFAAGGFLSTPSARRATLSSNTVYQLPSIFLSTPSARRATEVPVASGCGSRFLSTPSARRATDLLLQLGICFLISIHALREEGDSKNGEKHLRFCFIVKRSAQIWKSLSKNIRKKSRNLHRTA